MVEHSSRPLFGRIALIGMGLIGASLALAIRRGGLASHVAACDLDEGVRATVRRLGLADSIHDCAAGAARDADLVLLCVPVGAMGEAAGAIAPALKPGALVSDAGSVKQSVIAAVTPHLPEGVTFIPGHPIAGTEHSGPEAGFAELFDERWCILTPLPDTDETAVNRVASFWRGCGSDVERMDPAHHDIVLAVTSHLPHLIAYTIVGTAADLETVTRSEVIKYSAGGFRDFTRIAASDPVMWRDIFLANREAVLEILGRFSEDLTALQRAIRWGEADALYDLFVRTRSIRRNIVEAGQETPDPDFGRRKAGAGKEKPPPRP
ncbi:MAG: prephenate/arogenate dehydrogenase family protein [Alphaproteobacteria bacterium]